MPGLLGTFAVTPGADVAVQFDRVLRPMDRGEPLKRETLLGPDARWALARIHLGILNSNRQLNGGQAPLVLFRGEVHNAAELRESLGFGVEDPRPIAALVGALYEKHGPDFVRRLSGSFVIAIVDSRLRKLLLANDTLGSYPLYWFKGARYFTFASELKSVIASADCSASLDVAALADYMKLGFLLGNKSLADGVEMLPAGATLSLDWESGNVQLSTYSRVEDLFARDESDRATYTERVVEAFDKCVGWATADQQHLLAALSGGLDSRAILSSALRQGRRLQTYTLGVKGCADEAIAKKLAGIAGGEHRFFELDSDYLDDFLPNLKKMVSLTDGMYLSHGLTEMLAMKFLHEEAPAVLLRGHCGELAKTSLAWPLHTDPSVWKLQTHDELVTYLTERLSYLSENGVTDELFTDPWADRMRGQAERSLRSRLDDLPLSLPDCCSYLYLMEHHRRFTAASLDVFRNLLEVRLPFSNVEFLRVLFSGPPEWREQTELLQAIIEQNDPRMARVRNSNTGAPANSPKSLEFILDKLNTVLMRLNMTGYRHYHSFEGWMRVRLLSSVEEVLLSEDAVLSEMVKRETLRKMVDQTRSGEHDHGYLLQVLLNVELWQREFVA